MDKKKEWYKKLWAIILFVIILFWMLNNIFSDYESPEYSSDYDLVQQKTPYDEYNVLVELAMQNINQFAQIDCKNQANFNKASLGNVFHVHSKWIPSTKEGTFDSLVEGVKNNGCTNLYPNFVTYIVFDGEVIRRFESGCYSGAEPLKPTEGYGHAGVFYYKEDITVNKTGKYIVQKEVFDCKTKELLSKKAVMVDMGNINDNYYNKVVFAAPISIN